MNKKILIIGPSWIGDMVMAQSLFKYIKQQQPSVQLDILAPEWSREVLQRMPEISNCITLPIKHGALDLTVRIKFAKDLAAQNYSQAIVLANSWKSALIPFLARIPVRTGWLGEARWGLLNDVRYLNKSAMPKMVQRYVALGLNPKQSLPAELPLPKLISPQSAILQVINKFGLNTTKPILALCPGAAYGPAKRWPEEYFAQVARQKIAAGWQVWLFGSQQDSFVINTIQNKIKDETISFAGKVSLLETIDLISIASSVVSNDSGLLHIASSLDKPLVAIYGSTSPNFTPPLGKKAQIMTENLPCSPCFKRECPLQHLNCMYMIKPERVMAALQNLEEV